MAELVRIMPLDAVVHAMSPAWDASKRAWRRDNDYYLLHTEVTVIIYWFHGGKKGNKEVIRLLLKVAISSWITLLE